MKRQSSAGTLPTVDLATLKDDFGNRLCCIVCIGADGRRTIAEPCTTLAAARAFATGYNSVESVTGSRAEIRGLTGTVTAGKRVGLRQRIGGAQ